MRKREGGASVPSPGASAPSIIASAEPAPNELCEAVRSIPAVALVSYVNSSMSFLSAIMSSAGSEYGEQLVAALAAEVHACRAGAPLDELARAELAVGEVLRRLVSCRHFKRDADNRRCLMLLLAPETRRAYVSEMLAVGPAFAQGVVAAAHAGWVRVMGRRLDAARECLGSLPLIVDLEPSDELLALLTDELAAHELVDALGRSRRVYRAALDQLDKHALAAEKAAKDTKDRARARADDDHDKEAVAALRALQARGARALDGVDGAIKVACKRLRPDAAPAGDVGGGGDALALSVEAVSKAIRSHYRRQSLHLHPDKATPDGRERAQRRFELLRAAERALTAACAPSDRVGTLRVRYMAHMLDAVISAPSCDQQRMSEQFLAAHGVRALDEGLKRPTVHRMAEAGASTVGAMPRAAHISSWNVFAKHTVELRLQVPRALLITGGVSRTSIELQMLYLRNARVWTSLPELPLDDASRVRRPSALIAGNGSTHEEVIVEADCESYGVFKLRCARRRARAAALAPPRSRAALRAPHARARARRNGLKRPEAGGR